MPADSSRKTLRGLINGHTFVVTVIEIGDGLFDYSLQVDGHAVSIPKARMITSKGDGFQLGVTAAERHIEGLPRKP